MTHIEQSVGLQPELNRDGMKTADKALHHLHHSKVPHTLSSSPISLVASFEHARYMGGRRLSLYRCDVVAQMLALLLLTSLNSLLVLVSTGQRFRSSCVVSDLEHGGCLGYANRLATAAGQHHE